MTVEKAEALMSYSPWHFADEVPWDGTTVPGSVMACTSGAQGKQNTLDKHSSQGSLSPRAVEN